MAVDKRELAEIKKIFKEFAKIEKKGFKEVKKMAEKIWEEREEVIRKSQSNVKIMENHKPRNYRKSIIENTKYFETQSV